MVEPWKREDLYALIVDQFGCLQTSADVIAVVEELLVLCLEQGIAIYNVSEYSCLIWTLRLGKQR